MADSRLASKTTLADAAIMEFESLVDNGANPRDAFRQAVAHYPADCQFLSDYMLTTNSVRSREIEIDDELMLIGLVDSVGSRVMARMRGASAFSGILSTGQKLGIEPSQLASRLRLALSVLRKLDQRMIDAASIPFNLIEALGRELRVELTVIAAYLSGSPKLASAADYKSRKSPKASVQQQKFAIAINVSTANGEMSESDRDYWLQTDEGKNA